ncbi:DEAD/DEAH box helicase family protein [Caenispirillum bisanense]|uniref:Superfamily II DNA or RNA helicase n=1 Tax=Caenispirillum bisanense TaxID=414052 RepID=A0A286GIC8_9PROT|nr:DEAD/DEAH box helicase family protein [Caenispirillum bisanense]SOD95281.1 Superfamily II DNA or RNA helicase [Caenispirillum bisanense]
MITLKDFQETACDAIVQSVASLLVDLTRADAHQQRAIIRHKGCLLLKAPTGSGKTLTIGRSLELLATSPATAAHELVWFWFTPFSGLVGQTATALRGECPGLRVRNPVHDRDAGHTRSGDVFVTTWAGLAVQDAATRRMRQDDDEMPSVDALITALRANGWRIGAVVDESHHGFTAAGAAQARQFYEQVLKPDVTILTTATPKDADVELFQRAVGFERLGWVEVSREDAVANRLNKQGIRAVTFEPDPRDERLLDPVEVCITATVRHHRELCAMLEAASIPVVPLTLVQVENDGDGEDGVARMRTLLIANGVPEGRIAVHTADEPDASFHALANDHDTEFLIFKLAAATGFDVPRAWILASVRRARSKEFGLQVLGRIMRVHPLIQPRENLSDLLEYGYVFLANPGSQDGLVRAATDIKDLRTGMELVTDNIRVVSVAGDRVIIADRDTGWQAEFAAGTVPSETGAAAEPAAAPAGSATATASASPLQMTLTGVLHLTAERRRQGHGAARTIPPAGYTYTLKSELAVPPRLRREELPVADDGLLDRVVQYFSFTPEMLNRYNQDFVQVLQTETDVFTTAATVHTHGYALSERRISQEAQASFQFSGSIDPAALQRALLGKLRTLLTDRGWTIDERKLRRTLQLVGILNRPAIQDAIRNALRTHVRCTDAAPLPLEIRAPFGLVPSLRNIYGVMPPLRREVPEDARRFLPCFDSGWERNFARILDGNNHGAVRWWMRNEDRKDWAVSVVRPDGRHYYPDLVVAVDGRDSLSNIGLVEIKERIYDEASLIKVRTDHIEYGKILMLFYKEDDATFFQVEYNPATRTNSLVAQFDVDMLRRTT